jgi:hypothetical protein
MDFVIGSVKYSISPILIGAVLAFIAAVFAATLAFRGVKLSIENSQKLLRAQLDDAAKQKDFERRMTLRTKHFLEAAEWSQGTINAICRIAEAGLPSKEISRDMDARFGLPAKLELVGNTRVIELCLTLEQKVTEALAKFSDERDVLEKYRALIIALCAVEDDKTLTPEQRANAKAELDKLVPTQNERARAFAGRVYDEAAEQVRRTASFTVAMREELGMTINAVEYLRIVEAANLAHRKSVDDLTALWVKPKPWPR